jgi:iron complex outermembrane recepter protein
MGAIASEKAKYPCTVSAAVAAVLMSVPAFAQQAPASQTDNTSAAPFEGGLQQITVTATKRAENVQDVALTLTALSGQELEDVGALGFKDWSTYVPGLSMYQGGDANRRAGPTAVLRGVSQTGAGQLDEMSSNATTSFMIGQVPIFSGDPGLFDINRIEVLKGPQGTLFGIASMGGTIRFMPNLPRTDKFEASYSGGAGTINQGSNTYTLSGMVNMPIVQDKLAVRFAGIYNRNDGYIDVYKLPLSDTTPNNIVVSNPGFDPRQPDGDYIWKDANKAETTGARAAVLFTPNENFSVDAFVMWQKETQADKSLIDYNDTSQKWVSSRFALEPQNDQFKIASVEGSWNLGWSRLEFVGGYYDSDLSETIDTTTLVTSFLNGSGANAAHTTLDADGPGGLPPDGSWPSATVFPFTSTQQIKTGELRMQNENMPLGFSLLGSPVSFDYVLGGFYMNEDRQGAWAISNPTWNGNRGPNTEPILTQGGLITGQKGGGASNIRAGFADLSLNLTRKFTMEGGIRYSSNSRDTLFYGYGDSGSGRAANGATVGDNLATNTRAPTAGGVRTHSVTPRYSLKYKIDDERMIYATAAKGERMPGSYGNPLFWQGTPGALPGAAQTPACQNLARSLGVYDAAISGPVSDTVWSYDLGLKSTWLDRRLLVNVAVYYLNWANLQYSVQMSQYNPACNILITANVGKVDIKGAELELAYVPIDPLSFNVAVGYTDAEIAKDVPGVTDSLGHPLVKGDSIGNTPPFTAAVGAEYRFPIMKYLQDLVPGSDYQGFVRLDWRYSAERLGANLGNKEQLEADPIRSMFIAPSYSLLDMRLGANGSIWSGAFYVTNLTNKRAVFASFRNSWLPNQRTVSVAQPLTVGFTLKRNF